MTDYLRLPVDFPPLRADAEEAALERWAEDWPWPSCECGDHDLQREAHVDVEAAILRDFTRCATRDHWSRRVAGWLGLEVGCTAPEWRMDDDGDWVLGSWVEGTTICVMSEGSTADDMGGVEYGYVVCPPLAALDPDDDRRLSDGSRLVDAVALLIAVLWVRAEQAEWDSDRQPDAINARDHAHAVAEAYRASKENA